MIELKIVEELDYLTNHDSNSSSKKIIELKIVEELESVWTI